MRTRTLESTSSQANGGFGKASLGLVLVAAAAATTIITLKPSPITADDDDPNKRLIDRVSDRVSDTVNPRPIPAPECDPNSQALNIARELIVKMNACCKDIFTKWDGTPFDEIPEVTTYAIAECSDIPTNPCALDVKRLEDALNICKKG